MRSARIQPNELFERDSPKFTVLGAGNTCRDFNVAFVCAPVVMLLHDHSVGEHFEQRSGHDLLRDARPARRAGRTRTDRSADSESESRGACPSRRR